MAENIPDNKPKTVRRPRLKLPFDNRKEDAGVWAYAVSYTHLTLPTILLV